MKFSIKDFFSKCDLYIFTEEILNETLIFLGSDLWNFRLNYLKKKKTLLGSIQESLQNLGQHSQQNNKLFEIQIALILGLGFSSFIFYVEHIN